MAASNVFQPFPPEPTTFNLEVKIQPAVLTDNKRYGELLPEERIFYTRILEIHKTDLENVLSDLLSATVKCTTEQIFCEVTTLDKLEKIWRKYNNHRDENNVKLLKFLQTLPDWQKLQTTRKEYSAFIIINEKCYRHGLIDLEPAQESSFTGFHINSSVDSSLSVPDVKHEVNSSQPKVPEDDPNYHSIKQRQKANADTSNSLCPTTVESSNVRSIVEDTTSAQDRVLQDHVRLDTVRNQEKPAHATYADALKSSTLETDQESKVQVEGTLQTNQHDTVIDVENCQEQTRNTMKNKVISTDTSCTGAVKSDKLGTNDELKEKADQTIHHTITDMENCQVVFKLRVPKRFKADDVCVHVTIQGERFESDIQANLKNAKTDRNHWQTAVEIPIKDSFEYSYNYGIVKKAGWFMGKETTKKTDKKQLKLQHVIMDVFTDPTDDHQKQDNDLFNESWAFISFCASHTSKGKLKSDIVCLNDNKMLQTFKEKCSVKKAEDGMKKIAGMLKPTQGPHQKLLLLCVIGRCIPTNIFQKHLSHELAKQCLEIFDKCDPSNFPSDTLPDVECVLKVIYCKCFDHRKPLVSVMEHLYKYFSYKSMKMFVQSHFKSRQSTADIVKCIDMLMNGLQNKEEKAVCTCILVVDQITDFKEMNEVVKTLCHSDNIDSTVKKKIMDFVEKSATLKAEKCVKNCQVDKSDSIAQMKSILEKVEIENMMEKIKGISEEKILDMINKKTLSSWNETEYNSLHYIIVSSFLFTDQSKTKLFDQLTEPHGNTPSSILFLEVLGQSQCLSREMAGYCKKWLYRAMDNVTCSVQNSDEKLYEYYKCFGNIADIPAVNEDTDIYPELENIVYQATNKFELPVLIKASNHCENLHGRAKQLFETHTKTKIENIKTDDTPIKSDKAALLKKWFPCRKTKKQVLTLNHEMQAYLIENLLNLLPEGSNTFQCEEAARNITVVNEILQDIAFWESIFNVQGSYAYKVKDHIAVQNVKTLLRHLASAMENENLSLSFVRGLLMAIENNSNSKFERILKAMEIFPGNGGWIEIIESFNLAVTNVDHRNKCVLDMYHYLQIFDNHEFEFGVLKIENLFEENGQFEEYFKHVSVNHNITCDQDIADWHIWHLDQAEMLSKVSKLESFRAFCFENIDACLCKKYTALLESEEHGDFNQDTATVHTKPVHLYDDTEDTESKNSTGSAESSKHDSVLPQDKPLILFTVSDMVEIICEEMLASFRKKTLQLYQLKPNTLFKDIETYFVVSDVGPEISQLESFIGDAVPAEMRKILIFLRNQEELITRSKDMVRLASVFGIDDEKDTSELLEVAKNVPDTRQEETRIVLTLREFFMSMTTFDQATTDISDDLWSVINELSRSTTLIEFLKSVIEEDLRNLIDAVEEHSEQFVQESTVSDLISLKRILLPILIHEQDLVSFEVIIQKLKILHQDSASKTIPQIINNCSLNCNSLKALYMNVANRGEVTKKTVANIMHKGLVRFDVKLGGISALAKCVTGDKSINYSLNDLADLRSRALLISNTERNNERCTLDLRNILLDFVTLVDNTFAIADLLKSLNLLGHFEYQVYTYETNAATDHTSVDQLHVLLVELEAEKENWQQLLQKARCNYYYLNFVHSKQLCSLYLYCTSGNNRMEAISILRYINPGLPTTFEISTIDCKECSPVVKLNMLGEWLHDLLDTIPDDYIEFPTDAGLLPYIDNIGTKVQPGEVYVVHVDVKTLQAIPVILSLYANTTGIFPLPKEILFCSVDTTWEEVNLLINRCVFRPNCTRNNLYSLIGIEHLRYEVQYQLVSKIQDLQNAKQRKDFLLAIICRSDSNNSFVASFSENVHKAHVMTQFAVERCLQKASKEAYMITSELPGQGKTEKVYKKAEEKFCGVVTVPINGPLTKNKLVCQIRDSNVQEYEVLHLNVNTIQQHELFDHFIFELLILKCVVAGTECVHLNTLFVSIEVGNTLNHSLRDSLHVCSSFSRVHLDWDHFRSFIVCDETESSVQLVCQYLRGLRDDTVGLTDIPMLQNSKPFSTDDCRCLLQEYFEKYSDMSYNIAQIFLEVVAEQLRKFSHSHYFRVNSLREMLGIDEKVKSVRTNMIKALTNISEEFSCRSVGTYRKRQNQAIETIQSEVEFETLAMVSRVEGMIQWSKSNHLLVIFQSLDSQSVSCLYRNLYDVPGHIQDLFMKQGKSLPDFNQYTQNDLKNILEKVVCKTGKLQDSTQFKTLCNLYALTPDNILKMVLVALRIQAKIPVVLMGETGCGKTTLLKYLAATCGVRLELFPIHAGVSEDDIIKRTKSYDEIAREMNGKDLWVFFDEINTSCHLGLITEIICYKTCQGKPLSSNLSVLAACNPYRLRDISQIHTAGLTIKTRTDELSNLVYRVYPLPETMIDYVWDYGTIHIEDEKLYIQRMIENLTNTNFLEKLVSVLAYSQAFIRASNKNESSVSLRDVHRCRSLIKFFKKFLQEKLKYPLNDSKKWSKEYDKYDIDTKSIILTLAHCYVVRLPTNSQRKKYWVGVEQILFCDSQAENCIEYVRFEQLDILNRMVLQEGIAKNTALLENVFVLLVCILNKIPVFLVGKPGCSKSLSMQLLRSNLRGPDSEDKFFKTLPQLYVVSYQGSEASTSDGILKVFEKAEKYNKHNQTEDVLPVVLLDEVGLAEISHFNPLKVLHGLMEPDTGEYPEVAVVGISNWALDAAKMNRAIHLSRPELTVDELCHTAKAIRDGFERSHVPETLLKLLAEIYFDYHTNQPMPNFHGLRDYYALIKYICLLFRSPRENLYWQEMIVIDKGICRNFSGCGFDNSFFTRFRQIIQANSDESECSPVISTNELILDNLRDKMARHLMIITNGDSCLGIILNTLKRSSRTFEVIIGSKFEEDRNEEYNYRILSKIILCMEQGTVLVLKNLEEIYGSLYDMLNQNYTVVGRKRHCRIALGPHSNPMCVVDEHFRCVVIKDEENVEYSDPPFLNRFEKQTLHVNEMLNDPSLCRHKQQLNKWVHDFSTIMNRPFKAADAFLGFHKQTVPSLLHHIHNQHSEMMEDDLLNLCKQMLLKTCPPDAIMRLAHAELGQHEDIENHQNNYFNLETNNGFVKFLGDIADIQKDHRLSKFAIYTRSNINFRIEKHVQHLDVQIENLSRFKSEKHLTDKIGNFFAGPNTLLIIQCKPSFDTEHMLLLKLLLENHASTDNFLCSKTIIIILHLNRHEDEEIHGWEFDYTNDWHIYTVDRLESTSFPFKTALLGKLPIELFENGYLPLSVIIEQNLIWGFGCLKYRNGGGSTEVIWNIINQIKTSDVVMSLLQSEVLETIVKTYNRVKYSRYHKYNWQVVVACNADIMFQGYPLVEAWKIELTDMVKNALVNTIWLLENYSMRSSYVAVRECGIQWLEQLWMNAFKTLHLENSCKRACGPESIDIFNYPLNLCFPLSQRLCKSLIEVVDLVMVQKELDAFESLDDMAVEDRSAIVAKYQDLVEQRYTAVAPECDEKGFEMLTTDLYNIMSHFPGITLKEQDRTSMCKKYLETKYINYDELGYMERLTQIVLCWALHQEQVKGLLQLASTSRLHHTILETLANCQRNVEQLSNPTLDGEQRYDCAEILVSILCNQLLPTNNNMEAHDSSKSWFQRSSQLLTFASKVCFYPASLHFLRFCVDMFCFFSHCEKNLFWLLNDICPVVTKEAIDISTENTYFESTVCFNKFIESIPSLCQGQLKLKQRNLCLYFGRCIDANPDSQHLHTISEILIHQGDEDDTLPYAGPILHRMLQYTGIMENLSNILTNKNVSLQNECIEEALNSIEFTKYHPFVILCLDLVEDFILNSGEVNTKCLNTFESAVTFSLNANSYNLKYLVNIAYIRLFLQHSCKQLHNDKNTEMVTLQVYSIIAKGDRYNEISPAQLYLMKLLHTTSIQQLKERVLSAGTGWSSCKKISWPRLELQLATGFNGMAQNRYYKTATEYLSQNSLEKVMEGVESDYSNLQGAIAAISEKYFWVSCIRPLSDSEKTFSEAILGRLNNMNGFLKLLYLGSLGRESFPVRGLCISTQSTFEECCQASFLLHVLTDYVTYIVCEDTVAAQFWKDMTNKPLQDEHLQQIICLSDSMYLESTSVDKCNCGYVIFQTRGLREFGCPNCRSPDTDNLNLVQNIHKQTRRTGTCITGTVLDVLISSYKLALSAFNKSPIEDGESAFKEAWTSLKILLSFSDNQLAVLLHAILEATKGCTYLNNVVEIIKENIKHAEQTYVIFKREIIKCMASENELFELLEETNNTSSNQLSEMTQMSLISRKRRKPTVEHLQNSVIIATETSSNYTFLRLLKQEEDTIILVKHLPSLIKWYTLLHQLVHHRISRKDAKVLTFQDLISDNLANQEKLKNSFIEFKISWDKLRKSRNLINRLRGTELSEINLGSQLVDCIIHNNSHPLYQVIYTLSQFQNEFIYKAASEALNECLSLAFLIRESTVYIPSIPLHMCRTSHIVALEWPEELLIHSQNNTKYGYGDWIEYDLERIEKEMADLLLTGKCFILVDGQFPYTVYQKEMFHWCNDILVGIKKRIYQTYLPDTAVERLKQHAKEKSLRSLLTYLEVIVSLMHKTSTISAERIGLFAVKWGVNDKVIDSPALCQLINNSLCLNHVVALYEFVEENIATVTVESLADAYTTPLNDEIKEQIESFLQNGVPASSFLTAIRRFTIRYLANDFQNIDVQSQLLYCLSHDVLWPMCHDEVGYDVQNQAIQKSFPTLLQVEHIKALHDHLVHITKPKTDFRKTSSQQSMTAFAARRKRFQFGKT